MKRTFLVLVITMLFKPSHAQFYKSIMPSPEFSTALQQVVLDFRYNYKTIQGDSINNNEEAKTFTSAVKLPGASACLIYHYNSKVDTTATWQAIMYSGDDYKAAVKAYENTYRLVRKSQIKWIDKSTTGFSGNMEPVSENLRFAVSTLDFDSIDPRYKKYKAEIEMITSYAGYEVHLSLLTKKPDDER